MCISEKNSKNDDFFLKFPKFRAIMNASNDAKNLITVAGGLMNDSFYGELCIIGMRGCEAFTAEVDNYIKDWRRHVEDETYIAQADCPRFGSGEAKGLIH